MGYALQSARKPAFASAGYYSLPRSDQITCRWEALRAQILLQWNRLTSREIDSAGPNRHKLALLIQNEYGVASELVENYLRNFERTLPLA